MFTMYSDAMIINPTTMTKKVIEDFIVLYIILLSIIIISFSNI
jgi:hypothetical protein